jgi:hypothetical protein
LAFGTCASETAVEEDEDEEEGEYDEGSIRDR